MAQMVKRLPTMRETWVQSLSWEGRLEKGTATHSSILAWRIPWTVWSMGSQSQTQPSASPFNPREDVLLAGSMWEGAHVTSHQRSISQTRSERSLRSRHHGHHQKDPR